MIIVMMILVLVVEFPIAKTRAKTSLVDLWGGCIGADGMLGY